MKQFFKRRVVTSLGLSIASVLTCVQAGASEFERIDIGNNSIYLGPDDQPDSYAIGAFGKLDVSGGTVDRVTAYGGTIAIHDGSFVRQGIVAGKWLDVVGSVVHGDSNVAVVVQEGGVGNITGSLIEGGGLAVSSVALSTVNISNSSVTALKSDASGYGWGVGVFGGTLNIAEESDVVGLQNGAYLSSGRVAGQTKTFNTGSLIIEHAALRSIEGAAIKVENVLGDDAFTDIQIKNGATIIAGNGRILEVVKGGHVSFRSDKSELIGDLHSDPDSLLDVGLTNGSILTGNVFGVNLMTIGIDSKWFMSRQTEIGSMVLDGGSVGFTGDGFHSLSLGKLSGSGLFDMRINLDDGTGDLLSVNGEASGRHRLRIQNTGTEAVPAEFDPLRVVHTEGGDAEFGLVGGRADLGVYSYALERQGTDWFIVGSGKEISPSTKSALALFNTAPTVWNSELTTLRSRMGEVRGQEQGGGWMRTYGSRFNASLDSGVDYSQKQQGLSFGADAPVPVGNGQLLLGLMGGYSKSDLDIGRGTSGQVDSYYVGAYGTWLSEGGYYLDGVLKLNQFHNESKVAMSDGTKAKGDYSSKALGGSLEVGKHVKLGDEYFVEPFAQVSSVWIDGSRYTLDNGMQARTNQTQSVLGKVGSTVGRSFALKDGGVVKPYARVALAHEFSRSNDVSVNGQRFDNDLFGSRAELGAGVSVSLSERLQVHVDFDYMKGEHVEQPWGANVGVRLAF
ncbi:autotransporter outer membrane beta-barrel domain-containing protein [Pseudomonas sp. KU26590]|uniref:autotransporter outer membrane beta-barrel domain-containing protein n=1 Tax=Pseudomonas sp. KU26590 TaxID=2991051 RepID=UPI00223DEE04|nr:autotransporter outer membrane beta-barrel domain-containing protein [Pseudomonas sp. KU26590]UZJ62176.1 autotransporter outer membrane beta-barrel domain-containing protein [Pseudomonas sp. KU26590]